MTADPRGVMRIQSPWRQVPGYSSKYESCSFPPSVSPHRYRGMDGIGLVMTSSPTSSTSGFPSGDQDSTAAPRARQDSSPSQTGTSGAEPTNAVHRSVP